MKMFLVVYVDYFDERISKTFMEAGFENIRKCMGLRTGAGVGGKLGTHYSPGKNNSIFMAVQDEEIPRLLEVIRGLRAEYPGSGFRAFTLPLEECI